MNRLRLSPWMYVSMSIFVACQGPSATESTGGNNEVASSTDANGTTGTTPATATSAKAITIKGSAPAGAENRTVTAFLIDGSQTKSATTTASVRGGAFSLTLENASANANLHVALFVDINGDTVCNIAPTDMGALAPIAADGTATVALDANAQAPCSLFGNFSFAVSGNDFTPHNGETIYAAIRDTKSDAYVTVPQGFKVANAAWALKFPGALVKGRAYELRYFVDLNASHTCQDHSWKTAIAAPSADVAVKVSHDTAQSPVCTDFPAL